MKKIIFITLFVFVNSLVYSQVDVTAGMGINFVSQSSLKDYINSNFGHSTGNKLETFSTSVEFMGEAVYTINPTFQIGIEYANSLFSYNTNLGGNTYDLSYNIHKPSIVAYYVIPGKGYKFKFGGGIGARVIELTEKFPPSTDYTATGWGIFGRIEGHTKLTTNLYAFIAGDMRYDAPGNAKDDNDNFFSDGQEILVDLNSLAFGVKLGVSYFL